MSFLKKIFGIQKPAAEPKLSKEATAARKQIQDTTNLMWKEFENILSYYIEVSCQCAFPRFHQYVSVDCVDYAASFYMSETEGLIFASKPYFERTDLTEGREADNAIYTCKKCGSTYDYGWSDFSIHVNRTVLKIKELKTETIGAPIITPIPFVVGLFGHKYPERSLFQPMELENFAAYLKQLK